MLKPAICYKEEIEQALAEYFYTNEMMYYIGANDSYLLHVEEESENGKYQWAVVNNEDDLIGFINYRIDYYASCAYNFGAFSFDKGNILMGKELFELFEKLLKELHKVEFRAVSGNPATRGYDSFLKRHSDIGIKHILKDEFRDTQGNYHDDYIYEFINRNSSC